LKCRHCQHELSHIFLDLGFAPPSNAYLRREQLNAPEVTLPLRLFVCSHCWLVQTEDFTRPTDLFDFEYAYYSSTSETWLKHAADYASQAAKRFGLGPDSFVVEVASNDGYLLRNFLDPGIPCLGIEPTLGTAQVAESLGIPVLHEFFGRELARKLASENKADLIIGNNVYAHVPDINDFTLGLCELLKDEGVITLEFPHLMQLIDNNQFDTVYHEHFSYLSLYTVQRIFAQAGLRIWDVDELPTHGGSLRVYGCHAGASRETEGNVATVLEKELASGLRELTHYLSFQERANRVKNDLLTFLIEQKRAGKAVAAYGAAAKGNTLLNFAGAKPDLLAYVCDAAPSKQGKFMPGSHVPILKPEAIGVRKPDFVLILPWNIASEVQRQNAYISQWGGRFVVAVPEIRILGSNSS
jgi:hypothetical protein